MTYILNDDGSINPEKYRQYKEDELKNYEAFYKWQTDSMEAVTKAMLDE